MFKLIIDNITIYKDSIDEIIIKYYKYIEKNIQVLNVYFKRRKENQKDIDKNKDSMSTRGEMDDLDAGDTNLNYTMLQLK